MNLTQVLNKLNAAGSVFIMNDEDGEWVVALNSKYGYFTDKHKKPTIAAIETYRAYTRFKVKAEQTGYL